MSPFIEDSYGVIDSRQIEELEKTLSISLPEDYKRFLLRSNGGAPARDRFSVPDWHGVSTGVNRFYGIHDGKYNNLKKEIETYRNRVPSEFIPIGCDPGGNLICMGIAGDYKDKIYFWDHEDELDEEGDSKADVSNMFWLADNLNDFLKSLG